MTSGEREQRRREKLAIKLDESLTEARAAREDLDRIARASEEAFRAFAAISEQARVAAEREESALAAHLIGVQKQAADAAQQMTMRALEAAKRLGDALSEALGTRGKISGATKQPEVLVPAEKEEDR